MVLHDVVDQNHPWCHENKNVAPCVIAKSYTTVTADITAVISQLNMNV